MVDDDRIVRNAGAPPTTMAEEGEIIQELGRYIEAKLTSKYGFVQLPIPGEDVSPSTNILASRNWMTASKLLLIIQNASGSMMGIFSRSLCLEQGLRKGSMLPFVDRALVGGYAVLILRPNANSVISGTQPDGKPRKIPVPGSESPEVHALCVWENVVARNEKATHIALLGYGNGAYLCKELLSRQMVKSKEDESELNRIKAFVTIEASEIIDEDDGADIKNFLSSVAVNMECNRAPRGYRLAYRRQKLGCTSISLGLPTGAAEVTNVAESLELALEPVFKYLDVTCSTSSNVISRFVQAMAEENGHAYTQAEVASPAEGEEYIFKTPVKATVPAAIRSPVTVTDDLSATVFAGGMKAALDASAHKSSESARPAATTGFLARMFGSSISFKSAPTAESLDAKINADEKLSAADFDLLNIVGKGAFGKVMLVRKKYGLGEGKYYAMKILKKSFIEAKGQIENTKSEREILCEIRHPFIVRLRFAFQNDEKLYLVTDYYNGGTLFYHLRKSRAFSEDRARFYASELLLALDHLHSQSIIYRDLKLENVLLDHVGHVALTDFGLSKQDIDKTGGASTFCGTFEYIAPELFNRQRYGKAVDWWSFGILL